MAWRLIDGAIGIFAIDCCCKGEKNAELPKSELLTSGDGFSSLGLLLSGLNIGSPELNPLDFKLPFMEAASSATREDRTDVSI